MAGQAKIGQKRKAATLKENTTLSKIVQLSPNTSAARRRNFFNRHHNHRHALTDVSSNLNNSNTNNNNNDRKEISQLLTPPSSSPYASPSKSSKRRRILRDLENQQESFKVGSFNAKLQKLVSESNKKIKRNDDDFEIKPRDQKLPTSKVFREIKGDVNYRLLQRSLDGQSFNRFGGFHYGDAKIDTNGFYSVPDDIHEVLSEEGHLTMPFCVNSFNNHPIAAVGDESGRVRLLTQGALSNTAPAKNFTNFQTPLLSLTCHDNAVFDLSISGDDRYIATASGDQTASIFDVTSQRCVAMLSGHTSSVKQVAFNPLNQNLIVTSSRDGNVNIWDLRVSGVADGEAIKHKPVNTVESAHSITHPKKGTLGMSVTAAIWGPRLEFQVATACEANAEVKVWDIRSLRPRMKHPVRPFEISGLPPHHNNKPNRNYGITSLNLSPNCDRIYALCKDAMVYAYSANNLTYGPLHAYACPNLRATSFYVKSSLSKDGQMMATGSTDGSVVLFPTEERYLDRNLYGTSNASFPSRTTKFETVVQNELVVGTGTPLIRGHSKEVTGVSWLSDGSLYSISDDFTVRCWKNGDNGDEARDMREGGESGGRRWGWGWADRS